jgi:hypothetical protein
MTKDEAMKLALEALEEACEIVGVAWTWRDEKGRPAITAIKQALAAPVQEPWKSSDTAHRPGGLPQDFIKHDVENEDDWSEWVNPHSEQYFMKCCDCGLVHEMQFKVAKYSEGDECEFVADANLQAVFRARRATPPAAQPAPVQEPVASARFDGTLHWIEPYGVGLHRIQGFLYTSPQPKQEQSEPVAWMFEFPDKRVKPKFDSAPHGGNWQPLYIHPQPDAYGYAKRLSEAIWKKHYQSTAPQWEPFDDLMGVLTQIDNMTAGLITPPAAPVQEPVALEAVYETIIDWDEGGGKRSRRELARRIVDLYTTPPQRTEQEPLKPTAQEVRNAAANLALMKEMWGDPNQPAAKVNDEGFIVETGLLLSPGTLLYTQRTEQEPIGYLCENATGHRYFRWKKPPSVYNPIALYAKP